ncbi:MAG: response regulator [Fischerella sp.]|uniref:response regulator n=1 Tax=Fischerella sp. TaxID=1191 RepID=UPI001830FCF1|nr:response regulator [Fischerella sp.]NWF62583.1 response regulator [Fischerella sp.]
MTTKATKKILFIDDEPYIQYIVKACLEKFAGWEVVVAKSGLEGLIKAEIEKPDAILLDGMMPEMNGIICLQKLQLNPKTQSLPVIFLTAKWSLTEPHRFLELGAVGAIAKPFDPLTLVTKMTKILGWNVEDLKAEFSKNNDTC